MTGGIRTPPRFEVVTWTNPTTAIVAFKRLAAVLVESAQRTAAERQRNKPHGPERKGRGGKIRKW